MTQRCCCKILFKELAVLTFKVITILLIYWKKVDTHAILCHLVKSLNCVVYEHVLIKKVTEEVERTLTAINVNRVFT